EDLARLEARNVGKPIADARAEVAMVADVFDYYAGAPERLVGETIPVPGGIDMTFREPLGVVGLITPWNFPLPIASWKVAPALADTRRALGAGPVHGAPRAFGGLAASRRPPRPRDRDGPAHLRRPAREGLVVPRRRPSARGPRQSSRRPRLLVPTDGALPRLQLRPRGPRGDLRPDRLRDPVRRRGGGRVDR